MTNLTRPRPAKSLLSACTSVWEWNAACKRILAANPDEDNLPSFPDWWHEEIVESGLWRRMHVKFERIEAAAVMAKARAY